MINGRLVRLHSFTSAEIFFGYTPEWIRTTPSDKASGVQPSADKPSIKQINHYLLQKDEKRAAAVKQITTNNARMEKQS